MVCFQVVSLLKYDDAEQGVKLPPSTGYPVVCVTVSLSYFWLLFLHS